MAFMGLNGLMKGWMDVGAVEATAPAHKVPAWVDADTFSAVASCATAEPTSG